MTCSPLCCPWSLEYSGGPVMGGASLTGHQGHWADAGPRPQSQPLTLLQAETSPLGSSWLQQMKASVWPGRMWTISGRVPLCWCLLPRISVDVAFARV